MTEQNNRVDECVKEVDAFLEKKNIKPVSKKRFPVDGGSLGVVYKLGHFGIEVTVHQFIIFSKYNSRYIDMVDYKTSEKLLDYALPIAQEYIDDPEITKHIVVRQITKLKRMFSL